MEVERKRLDLLVCRNDCTRMVVKGIQCAWYPEFVLKVVLHHRKRFTRSFDLGGPDSPSRQDDRLLWKQKHRHTHTHTHTRPPSTVALRHGTVKLIDRCENKTLIFSKRSPFQ